MTANVVPFRKREPKPELGYSDRLDPDEIEIERAVEIIARELGGITLHHRIAISRALEEVLERALARVDNGLFFPWL